MASAILGLLAETPVHAGSSTSTGVIDLPIQREAHTGWPCVFGSAVKGALRTQAEDKGMDWIEDVFGPPAQRASDHSGALAVSDARLLLLPVRSLTTHFKWVTCPALLQRATSDCRRMNLTAPDFGSLAPNPDRVMVHQPEPAKLQDDRHNRLFLEELSFTEQPDDLSAAINFLAQFMGMSHGNSLLSRQLAIVHNDRFAYLAQFATPVAPHIAINYETKTVKGGALWYEETLPPETVLYVCLAAHRSRRNGSSTDAPTILGYVTQALFHERPYLQLGGNETIGMGWCKVAVVGEGA